MQTTTAWIGMGSNEGERHTYLQEAIYALGAIPGLTLEAVSSVYETEPVGFESNDRFLNAVVQISCGFPAQELLTQLLRIETMLGRMRKVDVRYHSRTIDLDLLLFGQEVINNSNLQVPHPRLHERHFVLQPLNELIPSYIHPVLKRTIGQLVCYCNDTSEVFIHAKPLSVNH